MRGESLNYSDGIGRAFLCSQERDVCECLLGVLDY